MRSTRKSSIFGASNQRFDSIRGIENLRFSKALKHETFENFQFCKHFSKIL
jgi:hypothetical protein